MWFLICKYSADCKRMMSSFRYLLVQSHKTNQKDLQSSYKMSEKLCFLWLMKYQGLWRHKDKTERHVLLPLQEWGTGNVYLLSGPWTTLRGKHCQRPIVVMGFSPAFGQNVCWKCEQKYSNNNLLAQSANLPKQPISPINQLGHSRVRNKHRATLIFFCLFSRNYIPY